MRLWLYILVAAFVGYAAYAWWARGPSITLASSTHQLDAARAFLASDADGFVASFTAADLHARHASSGASYCDRAARAVRAPTPTERARLEYASANVSYGLRRLLIQPVTVVVVATTGGAYEDGMPHTRGRYVFLSPEVVAWPKLSALMAHEITHVVQRQRPAEARAWALDHGYTPRPDRTSPPLARANPDLDGQQWDGPSGAPVAFVYGGPRPIHLKDGGVVGGKYEHPYEAQAYGFS